MEETSDSRDYEVVYTVTEGKDGKSHWTRIGACFRNRDESRTLLLNALPTNGKLIVQKKREGSGLGLVRFGERRRGGEGFGDEPFGNHGMR